MDTIQNSLNRKCHSKVIDDIKKSLVSKKESRSRVSLYVVE